MQTYDLVRDLSRDLTRDLVDGLADDGVPSNAILDAYGNPMRDASGNYLLQPE